MKPESLHLCGDCTDKFVAEFGEQIHNLVEALTTIANKLDHLDNTLYDVGKNRS